MRNPAPGAVRGAEPAPRPDDPTATGPSFSESRCVVETKQMFVGFVLFLFLLLLSVFPTIRETQLRSRGGRGGRTARLADLLMGVDYGGLGLEGGGGLVATLPVIQTSQNKPTISHLND